MSFFEELKRRNVVRVGIAYVVASWILLQMTDVFVELLDLSNDVGRYVIMALAMGFIPALIFAWAFELTPEGVKREKDVDRTQSITPKTGRKLDFAIIALLAVGLVYFIWESRFSGKAEVASPDSETEVAVSIEPETADANEAISRQSIAVLPFVNRSDQQQDQYFVDGVHDDLLTSLSRIGSLKVISRTSVSLYKESAKSIPQIAEELGVATIMEGAVQRSGNTVRVNVQLIDAASDEHLWAEIFDRELTAENLFSIQSEISEKIASALETTLTDAERDRINTMPTNNLAAYDAYTRGRQLMATRKSAKLEEATLAFKEAIELDPDFALAWVGMADSHDLLNIYGVLDFNEALAIREDAVTKALELDPDLGEAHVSYAKMLEDQRDLEASETAYLRAIELNPNYATAYHWYSIMIGRFALRTQEVVDLARKAAELDPRSPIIGVNLGGAYFSQGRYSSAERQLLKVLELEPGFGNAISSLATVYRNRGQFDLAMKYIRESTRLDPGSPGNLADEAFVYLTLGEYDKAEAILAKLEEMDSERIGNGFISMWSNILQGNRAGALEAGNWILPRMEKVGGNFYFMSFLNAAEGDHVKAKEFFLKSEPDWDKPEEWPRLVERYEGLGCVYSWVLMAGGEQEKGQELLSQATHYLTEQLPAATEHADQYNIENCHLVAGNVDAAIEMMQTRLDHNHLGFWGRADIGMPWFDQIRDDERYIAIIDEHARRIAEQRELIRQMDEGTLL